MDIYRLLEKGAKEPIPRTSLPAGFSISDQDGEALVVFMDLVEFKANRELFDLPEDAVREILDSSQEPNIEFFDDTIFVTMNHIRISGGEGTLTPQEINFVIGENSMAVIYHGDIEELHNARRRMDYSSLSKALSSFMDGLLETYRLLIIRISDDAEDLEDDILQEVQVDSEARTSRSVFRNPDKYMSRIVALRKEVHLLRSYFEPTQDIIEILANQEDLVGENSSYFHKLTLKAVRLTDQLNTLIDIIAEVRSSWQSQVDLSFNKVVKLFTVVTAVFTPLNLLAGWFGMNFENMSLLSHPLGYPSVIALAILIPVLSLSWFKRNHYL